MDCLLPKKPRKVYQKKTCVSADDETSNTLIDESNHSIEPEFVETQDAITSIGSTDSVGTVDGIEPTTVDSGDNSSSLIPNIEGVSGDVGEECDDRNAETKTNSIEIEDKAKDESLSESQQAHYTKTPLNKKLSKKERRAQKRLQQKGAKH